MPHPSGFRPTSVSTTAAGKLVAATIALVALVATASGQTAPLLHVERMGLYGPEQTGIGGIQSSTVAVTPLGGRLDPRLGYVGTSTRYDSAGASNGANTWFYSRELEQTVPIGLVGQEYTGSGGFQSSRIGDLTSAGIAFGSSSRVLADRTLNGQDRWAFDAATGVTTLMGLTGPQYTGSQGYRSSSNSQFFGSTVAAGTSDLITGVDTVVGRSAWVYSALTRSTSAIGLMDDAHTNATGAGQHSIEGGMNNFIAGTSARVGGPNGTFAAEDLWLHDVSAATTIQIGLSESTFSNNHTRFVMASGLVTGTATRGVTNGNSMWVYRPATGTTSVIGLTDDEHTGSEGYQQGIINLTYPSGETKGASYQIAGLRSPHGLDTWFESPATGSVRTNLIDAEHTGLNGQHDSENSLFNIDPSNILGRSTRFSASGLENGHDAWIFQPGQGTTVIGLTDGPHSGSAGYRAVTLRGATPTGLVLGVSERFTGTSTNNGQSAWIHDSATEQTVQIGLSGAGYRGSAGYEFSNPTAITAAGQAIGTTNRVLNVNTANGANTWVYRASTHETIVTGLTGQTFTGSAGYQYSENFAQNEAGVVVGFSRRITGISSTNGQNAWYFDPAASDSFDILDGIESTVRVSDNYAFSSISLLTADGFALGRYLTFAADTDPGVNRYFLFRPDIGFYDLAALASGETPANELASLTGLQSANLFGDIVGYGLSEGQPFGSQSAFLMMRVPAPSTTLLAALACGLIGRRNRRGSPR